MAPTIFPAVEPGSALFPQLQQLREQITSDPALSVDGDTALQAELSPRRGRAGDVRVGRFYWSARRADPALAMGFTARTLYYDGKTGVSRTYDFPDDPLMGWLDQDDGPLRCHGDEAGVQILRYIPLRRVTFRLRDAAGLPARVIAKTKAPRGLLRATRAVVATHRAAVAGAAGAGAGALTVPRPIRLNTRRQLLYFEELPGRPLDEVLPQIGVAEGLGRLGALHRRLQELPVRGLRVRMGAADWLAAASVAAMQVGLLVPSAARQTQALYDELLRAAPDDGGLLFCHGDFVPSQILCHSSGWSVVDLDDAHYADPLAEVAALYATLPHDLGLSGGPAELARQAYLDAYLRQSRQPLDTGRWQWFLAVAELLQLARRTIRGRAVPGEAQAVLDRIGFGIQQFPA
ncbi:MAG TPA: aminoglycoside phosphotransferase family protein [Dermatophilaceae bacterium]|nr:aminoglycoside phosphotransferase family protein [Dermatophilaceae bacterium]